MHIPDGFLDPKTAVATGVLAVSGLGVALRQARLHLPGRRVPLLGLSAAFVFAAQLLNFPVGAGTSGHLMGGVLVAALLGPSATVIVMCAVLIVQCFLFADGGITALGANIFNMAMVGGAGGWAIYHVLSRWTKGLHARIVAAAIAAWCSTVLASIACAGELAASHRVGWTAALAAMGGVHALIGIGEGLITALVLIAIAKVRPELLGAVPAGPGEKAGAVVAFGLLISLGLALFVAPFACPWPDGLERTAQRLGFKQKESEARAVAAPMGDYNAPGIGSEVVATGVAGAAGAVVVFGIVWMLARGLAARKVGDADQVEDQTALER